MNIALAINCNVGQNGTYELQDCPNLNDLCYHIHPPGDKSGTPSTKGCIDETAIPEVTGGVMVAPGECKAISVEGTSRTGCFCNSDG